MRLSMPPTYLCISFAQVVSEGAGEDDERPQVYDHVAVKLSCTRAASSEEDAPDSESKPSTQNEAIPLKYNSVTFGFAELPRIHTQPHPHAHIPSLPLFLAFPFNALGARLCLIGSNMPWTVWRCTLT